MRMYWRKLKKLLCKLKNWLRPKPTIIRSRELDRPNPAFQPKAELRSEIALESLLENLENTVSSAIVNASGVETDGLRRLLSLISTVILEAQKVYSEILSILVKLKYSSINENVAREALYELDHLGFDFRRRRHQNFCSKLRELRESCQSLVLPELLKANIEDLELWLETFFRIESARSEYLSLERIAREDLYEILQGFEEGVSKYELVKEKASVHIEILNNSLTELQALNNKILGLSGKAGFLELVSDPERLQQASVSIIKDVTMVNEGDTFHVSQAGAVGRNARSDNNKFYQSGQNRTLAEAAAEIQNLLKQLEQTNPTATEAEKVDYVNDETTPSFKRRVVGALQAGGEAAIEEFLDNPYVNVGKAVVKGWVKPE